MIKTWEIKTRVTGGWAVVRWCVAMPGRPDAGYATRAERDLAIRIRGLHS